MATMFKRIQFKWVVVSMLAILASILMLSFVLKPGKAETLDHSNLRNFVSKVTIVEETNPLVDILNQDGFGSISVDKVYILRIFIQETSVKQLSNLVDGSSPNNGYLHYQLPSGLLPQNTTDVFSIGTEESNKGFYVIETNGNIKVSHNEIDNLEFNSTFTIAVPIKFNSFEGSKVFDFGNNVQKTISIKQPNVAFAPTSGTVGFAPSSGLIGFAPSSTTIGNPVRVDSIESDYSDNHLFLKVNYSADTIQRNDYIEIKLSPSISKLIKLHAFDSEYPIYATIQSNRVEVGRVVISYEGETCILTTTFNEAYSLAYNGLGHSPSGNFWLSAYIEYIGTVGENQLYVNVETNGYQEFTKILVKPGTGGGAGIAGREFTPGPTFGKHWRYGANSGNELFQGVFLEDVIKVDEIKEMRWYLYQGLANLTNRDMRASLGQTYYTTLASLTYSNNNPNPSAPYDRYNTNTESYLNYHYANNAPIYVNEPFHYNNVVIDDYLETGLNYGTLLCSPHDYLRDSIRIIRVIGRENKGERTNEYHCIADSNFLKQTESEYDEIYRFNDGSFSQSPFPGYRGLTISEFLSQLQSEGQLVGKSIGDILQFDTVKARDTTENVVSHN